MARGPKRVTSTGTKERRWHPRTRLGVRGETTRRGALRKRLTCLTRADVTERACPSGAVRAHWRARALGAGGPGAGERTRALGLSFVQNWTMASRGRTVSGLCRV